MEAYGFDVFSMRKVKVYETRREATDFKKLYRFEKENVAWIASTFLGTTWDRRGGGLSPEQKMQTFLRYVADPGYQDGVAYDGGITQSCVSRVVKYVAQKIVEKADDWILFPTTPVEIYAAKSEWVQEGFKIPCVIGAVDCTHVRIPKPSDNGDEYINRKGFPSFNVQATCDAMERFTSVCAEWPGSVHDSRIFKRSSIPATMASMRNTVLLADSGYGITPYLITPYENPSTAVQEHFNNVYAKERVIIERCFGQLKMRFPILHYEVRTKLESVSNMILSCFVLHNVAKFLKDPLNFPKLKNSGRGNSLPLSDGNFHEHSTGSASDATIRRQGQAKRQELAETLYSSEFN